MVRKQVVLIVAYAAISTGIIYFCNAHAQMSGCQKATVAILKEISPQSVAQLQVLNQLDETTRKYCEEVLK